MQGRHALVIERNFATHEDVEHNAEAPNVHLRASIRSRLEKLGCCKVETPAKGLQVAARREEVAEPKVDNFNIASFADEYVFDFEIAVYNAVAVAVIEGACDLSAELASLPFLQFAMRDDVVEHLAAVDIFKEHVPVIVRAYNVSQPCDVGMAQESYDCSLTSCSNLLGLIGSFLVGTAVVAIFC